MAAPKGNNYAEGNEGGRPSLYCKELLEKAKEYLTDYKTEGDVIPSVEGLSLYLEIARSTIYEWAKHEDKKEFSDTLELINVTQKKVLINKGLKGDFNSNITKLALGNHGYSEKVQQELSGPDGKPIEVTGIEVSFVKAKEVKDDS